MVPIVRANVDKASKFMTDEAHWHWQVGTDFEAHGMVAHKRGEYSRGDMHGLGTDAWKSRSVDRGSPRHMD